MLFVKRRDNFCAVPLGGKTTEAEFILMYIIGLSTSHHLPFMESRLRSRVRYGCLPKLSHVAITVTLKVRIILISQMKKLQFKEAQGQLVCT